MLAAPRARLALLRGEIDDIDSLVGPLDLAEGRIWFSLQSAAARLDALAAGRELEKLEHEAAPLLGHPGYLEPFALRALGIAREDDGMVERAHAAFEAMGLGWYAAETRRLVAQA